MEVSIIDQPRLGELLDEHTVTMMDLERLLYSDWEQDDEMA